MEVPFCIWLSKTVSDCESSQPDLFHPPTHAIEWRCGIDLLKSLSMTHTANRVLHTIPRAPRPLFRRPVEDYQDPRGLRL